MSPTLSVRDYHPAVCVKDRTLWAHDPRTADFYGPLSEQVIGNIYAQTAEDFWSTIVPGIAAEHGIDPDDIYSDGRSSGWLVVHGTSFLPYVVDRELTIPPADDTADDDTRDEYATAIRERDTFVRFATAIVEQGIPAAGASFVERLQERLDEQNTTAVFRATLVLDLNGGTPAQALQAYVAEHDITTAFELVEGGE